MALTEIITIAGQRPSAQALPTIVTLVIGIVVGAVGLSCNPVSSAVSLMSRLLTIFMA